MLFKQMIDPSADPGGKNRLVRWIVGAWHWLFPPTVAHADRQSHAAKRLRVAVLILIPVLIAGAGLFNARSIYQSYQNWTAKRVMSDAKGFFDENRHYDAYLKVLEAHSLNPENEDAIRMLGELYTASKRNEAVYFLDKLADKGVATLQDRLTKVRALMNLNQMKQASELLERLMHENPPDDTMLKLAEEVWGTKERNTVVLAALKDYVAKHPEDSASQLRLARYQIQSAERGEIGTALDTLWAAAEDPGADGLKAIEEIDALPALEPADVMRLIQRLNEHPKSTHWHKVAALRREVQLYPARRGQIVSNAVNTYRDAKREDLVPLVVWLKEMGIPKMKGASDPSMFNHILVLVSEETAKEYEPLLLNYLTALTGLGKMSDLERLVNDPAVAKILKKSSLAFYRAHLSFVTGKPKEEVRRNLLITLTSAQDDGSADGLLDLANYAEARGFLDVAEDAYRARSIIPRRERAGFEGLVRVCQINGNIEGLIEAAHEAVRRWPDDDNFMERLLYANILAGREVEMSLERALKLIEKHKEDSGWKLLVALAFHRLGDMDLTLENMQRINLNNVTEGQQAVFAAMALAGGFASEAKLVINSIKSTTKMLPTEQAFYERVRAQTEGIARSSNN